ncbi:MAG: EamA family transporter [Deltaproteobacteria bacterium]|nr:EamA family transporter [Deltaproteobacteria bacterium]
MKHLGPLLVASAALLWGTDAIFRYPIADSVDATFIVFAEHLLGVALLVPWVATRARMRREVFALNGREWAAAAFCGVFGSALATTLFTACFRYVNPSIAVLLQKLQPVIVVAIAFVALGERPKRKFYFWAAVSLAAGVVLSFPDGKLGLESREELDRAKGIFLAFAAAMLWAVSTVSSKVLLKRASPDVATLWRYVFGLVALCFMLCLPHEPVHWSVVSSWPVARAVLYVSFISGIFPMLFYYGGLSRTPASVTTFIELLYPISAVVLNTLVLGTPLTALQIVAGSVLMFAVTMIAL